MAKQTKLKKIGKFLLNLLIVTPAVLYQMMSIYPEDVFVDGFKNVDLEGIALGFLISIGINVVLDLIRYKRFSFLYVVVGAVALPIRPITQLVSVVLTFIALFNDWDIAIGEDCTDEPTFGERVRAYFFHITTSEYEETPKRRARSSGGNGRVGGSNNAQVNVRKLNSALYEAVTFDAFRMLPNRNAAHLDDVSWAQEPTVKVLEYKKTVQVTGVLSFKVSAGGRKMLDLERYLKSDRDKSMSKIEAAVKRAMTDAGANGWSYEINIKVQVR